MEDQLEAQRDLDYTEWERHAVDYHTNKFQSFNLRFIIMKMNIQDWKLKVLRQVAQVEDQLEAQRDLDYTE